MKRKRTPQQRRKDEAAAAAAYAKQTVQDAMCDCLQDEICAACRRKSGDGPLVMCQKPDVAAEYAKVLENVGNAPPASATNGQFSLVCAGCNGKKVQYRKTDGIYVLCPVCNGSGLMPPVASGNGAPGAGGWPEWNPWPFHQPYPWHPGGGGSLPQRAFPSQILD